MAVGRRRARSFVAAPREGGTEEAGPRAAATEDAGAHPDPFGRAFGRALRQNLSVRASLLLRPLTTLPPLLHRCRRAAAPAGRQSAGWLYMSRLAALKEFAFMKALHEEGFPTPTPIDANRHVVLMSKVPGYPMAQVNAHL